MRYLIYYLVFCMVCALISCTIEACNQRAQNDLKEKDWAFRTGYVCGIILISFMPLLNLVQIAMLWEKEGSK